MNYSIAVGYVIEQFKQEGLWKVSHTQGDTLYLTSVLRESRKAGLAQGSRIAGVRLDAAGFALV